MAVERQKKTVLSEKYAVFILVSLLENDVLKMSDFSKAITALRSLENIIEELQKAGLIHTKKISKPYRTTFISLTDLGCEVAKVLKKAEDVLNEKSQAE